MPTRPPTSTRAANRRRVLDLLRRSESASSSQAELARSTGLAPATVSNIVRDLVAAGLVETSSGSGRRGGSVRLSHEVGVVGGVDFGHSHLAVAIGDLTGALLAERRVSLPPTHDHEKSLAMATDMLAELAGPHGAVLRVALGIPSPIDRGVVRGPGILPGWHGTDVRTEARRAFGVTVDVENDANLGALAEHRVGVAAGHATSVFVKISSGVGAGIVLEDRLFHGATGMAGELGHLTLDDQGPVCRCGGRGCLEAYVSTETVLSAVAGILDEATLDTVIEAAAAGENAARRALDEAGLHLGWGLAGIVNLLNPEVVVIGGDMARAGERLLGPARIGLRRHALDSVANTPVIVSSLGERASLVGAVLLAAEHTELAVA